jgi:hypothetical protein
VTLQIESVSNVQLHDSDICYYIQLLHIHNSQIVTSVDGSVSLLCPVSVLVCS